MKKVRPFPTYVEPQIKRIFESHAWPWSAKKLADDILKLSNFYIQYPNDPTPWKEAWAQRALLVYYWPLNSVRFESLYHELNSIQFFNKISHFIDFGAGPGTAAWTLKENKNSVELVEKSEVPQKWFPDFQWSSDYALKENTCSVFCYSLTELSDLPPAAEKSDALIILEPATQQDGRKLLHLREKLIAQGYSVWAPCTHQKACPLLTHSKTDWCHDRIELQAPDWFLEIERHLPMKNRTITVSYLAVKKEAAPARSWARLTGDQLHEKGKTRQLVCRGEQREFLAWMHRDGEPEEYFRGEKVSLLDFDKKSNELRVKKIQRID